MGKIQSASHSSSNYNRRVNIKRGNTKLINSWRKISDETVKKISEQKLKKTVCYQSEGKDSDQKKQIKNLADILAFQSMNRANASSLGLDGVQDYSSMLQNRWQYSTGIRSYNRCSSIYNRY